MSNDARRTAERDESDDGLARRRLLVTGAAGWTAVGVAGCCSSENPPGPPMETDTETPTPTPTVTTETTTTDDTPGGDGGDDTPTPTPTPSPTPTAAGTTECDQESVFAPGQEIGFLSGVFDSRTGEPMGPDALSSVRLEFADDGLDDREMTWDGDHGDVVSERWGAAADDTDDLEPDVYKYEVVVTPAAEGLAEERVVDSFRIATY